MIKELKVEELPDAAVLGAKFFAESNLPGTIKAEIFEKNWRFLIDKGMGKIFGVYEQDKLVGALGAIIAPDLNDGELCVTEAFWFIAEAKRGEGVKLLLHFMKYAKEIGCVRVNMVHLFNSHADKLSKLYLRMGFSPVETHYNKNI